MGKDLLLLYFFSGTGNSYRAAMWMAETARRQSWEARVIPLDQAQPKQDLDAQADGARMVGLVCPTHGFTAPWAMIHFALRLPRRRNTAAGLASAARTTEGRSSAFAVLTRAGMKLGPVYSPGLDGTGAYLLALILALKGYRVLGAAGLDMPGSWTAVMPGFSRSTAEAIEARARPTAEKFMGRVLAGQAAFWSILPLILGLALLPLSLGYLLFGRFFLAKLFYASTACDGCGLCARSCPVHAIRMTGKQNPRPYWTFLCESCSRCINFCPRSAVEVSYPFGALGLYLGSLPVAALALDWLARTVTQAAGWQSPLVETIITYPYKLLSLAAAYGIFVLAMRVPLINRALTLASPPHYYRRYREPGTHLADLRREPESPAEEITHNP